MQTNKIIYGDAREVLLEVPDKSVRLTVTSPPYADQRKKNYGGIRPDDYVTWFLPIANQLYRVTADDGSFVLNIKEKVVKGERHTYVLELIQLMRSVGWRWTEEYIWHKRNCSPGKWPNRFRDAWERVLHFTKAKRFVFNQDDVMVPTGDWAKARLKNLVDGTAPAEHADLVRKTSTTGSKFGKRYANWVGRDKAYPSNVIHTATECANRRHSAAFPEAIPEFFVKLLSNPGDVVLDPFVGSGTTPAVARRLGRQYVGIDWLAANVALAEERVANSPPPAAPVAA